jgi:dihydroorotase
MRDKLPSEILFQQIRLWGGEFAGESADVLIDSENGITRIESPGTYVPQTEKPLTIMNAENKIGLSAGWFDFGVYPPEPGFPNRGTLAEVAQSALRGGYTDILCYPNTLPTVDSPEQLCAIRQLATGRVQFHFMAALTAGCQGKAMTEYQLLAKAGAAAFSDGPHCVQSPALLLRIFQYLQNDQLVIQQPDWCELSQGAVAHESVFNTRTGLKTTSYLHESLAISRDLEVLAAAGNGKLHFTAISTAQAVAKLALAAQMGLNVSASTSPVYVLLTDEYIVDFDTAFRFFPPLRSFSDVAAVRIGVKNNYIHTFSSGHMPAAAEEKVVEFEKALPGAPMLETAFGALYTALVKTDVITLSELIYRLTDVPRRLLGLAEVKIRLGSKGPFTIFDPTYQWQPKPADVCTRYKISPFFNILLTGKPVGCWVNGQWLPA